MECHKGVHKKGGDSIFILTRDQDGRSFIIECCALWGDVDFDWRESKGEFGCIEWNGRKDN